MRDTKRYSAQTIQTRFGYLSSALQWAVDNEELGRNPARGVKLPGRRANVRRTAKEKIVVPRAAEVAALVAATDDRYATLIWLMSGCGLRIGEAMACAGSRSTSVPTCCGSTGRSRRTGKAPAARTPASGSSGTPSTATPTPPAARFPSRPWSRPCCAHLKKYGTWGPDQILFPNRSRSGLLYQYYLRNQILLPAFKASKVSFTKTHALRHFFASSMLSRGVPITDLAAWLGHSSVEVTYKYYGHLMPDAPERGRSAIDSLTDNRSPKFSRR
ncbi:tyrosine-type recombinase/integrase [Plantactinospora siamensis]|uniref:Tyrosine-type recombinase/integrase n=1 Tax=Plantactinospora siamensis TaxID=555372 RepID=A0ABV6NP94_9ACTN